MKLKFLGVGGAFAPISKGNSNMVFITDTGGKLLLDCGTTAPYIFRDELGYNFHDIDAIYISHLHSDHIGGLEMIAFSRYFIPKKDSNGNIIRPKLYCVPELMVELWETSLKGGLESIEGKVMNLTDYFDCRPVSVNSFFEWNKWKFYPVQTIHVMSGYKFKNSYGLMIQKSNDKSQDKIFITTDTQFAPHQLHKFYQESTIIFHDCETLNGMKSHVHAHYEDLKTLPIEIRNKMWLYHYGDRISSVKEDGFAGFVDKGHEFVLDGWEIIP